MRSICWAANGSAGSCQCRNQGAAATVVAVFAQVNTLPSAQDKLPVSDWQGQRTAEKRRLDVGGHVIGTLERVLVERGVLRDSPREMCFKIIPNRGVGILVQGQTCAGVQDMDVQQANTDVIDVIELGDDLVGNQVKAAWPGCEPEVLLVPDL